MGCPWGLEKSAVGRPLASAWHYRVSLYAYGINVPSVSTSDGKQCGNPLGLGPSLWAGPLLPFWYKMRQHFSGMLTLNID